MRTRGAIFLWLMFWLWLPAGLSGVAHGERDAGAGVASLGVGQERGVTGLGSADAAGILAAAVDAAGRLWSTFLDWVRDNHARAPALVVGLGVVVAVPLLAVLGLLLRAGGGRRPRRQRGPHSTRLVRRSGASPASAGGPGDANNHDARQDDGFVWPVNAWIETEDTPGTRLAIDGDMLRIGRADDNELVVDADTVHRYHALVRRNEEAEIVIVDLSGRGGNGVVVAGQKVAEARLQDGDVIELGSTRLRFFARPA